MKIELESLQISALRDFDEDQVIAMPMSEVISVIGQNRDDGGSNGSGKSTFAMSPTVNLFGPKEVGISSASLKNRHLNVPVRTIGGYRVNGVPLKVDRTIGGKLRFKYGDNDWKEGKSDDIQAEIADIIKLTPEQFKVLSNKAQGDDCSFLLMKDSDKKDFLRSFFDLAFIESADLKAREEMKTLQEELTTAKCNAENITSNCVRLESELKKRTEEFDVLYGASFQEIIDAKIKEVAGHEQYLSELDRLLNDEPKLSSYLSSLENVKEAAAELQKIRSIDTASIKESLQNAQQEFKNVSQTLLNIPTVPEALLHRQSVIELVLKTNQKNQEDVRLLLRMIELKLEAIKNKTHEIEHSDGSLCKTCGNHLKPESIQPIKDRLCKEMSEIVKDEQNMRLKLSSISILKDEEEKVLRSELNQIVQDIASFLKENSQESLILKSTSLKQSIASYEMSLASNKKSLELAERALKHQIESSKSVLANSARLTENTIAQLKSSVNQLHTDRDSSKKILNEWAKSLADERYKMIKAADLFVAKLDEVDTLTGVCKVTSNNGFIGYIFDGILQDINSEINHNLKTIPNARRFSLQFTPDKVAKTTGTVSKSITYQLYSGNEEIEFNTLSGGEKLSVIISVDEALDTVLSRRLGVNLGWKFLDEQFSWIDENSKEAILEFYKTKADKKAYFIVDHASEFNASLDQRIVIIKENNLARFANANDL